LEIPIIGVSSLEAMASQVLYSELPIVPLLYSRRNEFFTTQFTRNNDNNLISNLENLAVKTDDLPSIFKDPSLFIGNDFSKQAHDIKRCLGSLAHLAPAHIWSLKASSVGALGLKRFHDKDFDEPQTLDPLYLRPPDIRANPFPLMTG
jgi:tRNA threonylcarbamoyladenosine biosynthesis protein TsaB